MGKRTLHNATYYTCDYTGLPMRDKGCYMPVWRNGRLTKKGSYCNWESVLRHAQQMCVKDEEITVDALASVIKHVHHAAGTEDVVAAPEYTQLQHFGGDVDVYEFHRVCCFATKPVTGVLLQADGALREVTLHPEGGRFEQLEGGTNSARLSLWCVPWSLGTLNEAATRLLKREILGDVLLVGARPEHSFLPRTRFTSISTPDVHELLEARPRRVQPTGLSREDFAAARAEMERSMKRFESRITADTATPHVIAAGAVMPPSTGDKLADMAELRGFARPERLRKLESRLLTAPPSATVCG